MDISIDYSFWIVCISPQSLALLRLDVRGKILNRLVEFGTFDSPFYAKLGYPVFWYFFHCPLPIEYKNSPIIGLLKIARFLTCRLSHIRRTVFVQTGHVIFRHFFFFHRFFNEPIFVFTPPSMGSIYVPHFGIYHWLFHKG